MALYANIPPSYGLARANYVTPGGTGRAQTVFGFFMAAGVGDAFAVANSIMSAWSNVMAALSEDYQLENIQTIVNNLGVLSEGLSTAPAVNGGVAAHALPSNVAVIVRKNTAVLGKTGRGHFSMPGVADGQQQATTDDLTIPAQTLWQGSFNLMLEELGASDVPLRILHKDPTLTPVVVQELSVQQRFGSQRRRLRKAPHH